MRQVAAIAAQARADQDILREQGNRPADALVGELATQAGRWPGFAEAAAGHGLDGALSAGDRSGLGPYADVSVASGILSVRHNLGVDDALARLRAAAYARGVSVSALAADIIAGRASLD